MPGNNVIKRSTFEEMAYDQDFFWHPENISAEDLARVKLVSAFIPADVTSLLDVGCGGGIALNYFKQNSPQIQRLCGIDGSWTALQYVHSDRINANIAELPVRSASFDLVTSFEVIEHFPLAIYPPALKEIARVAGRYILLSVPNSQNLREGRSTCPCCKTQFNADYHMRSFTPQDMIHLFTEDGFRCEFVEMIGPSRLLFGKNLLRNLLLKERFCPYAVCPMCGFNKLDELMKHPSTLEQKLLRQLSRFWPGRKQYRWLAARYVRM